MMIAGIMSPFLTKKALDLPTKTQWSKHPFALKMIEKMVKHYQHLGAVQMLAALSCVLSIPYKVYQLECIKKRKKSPEETVVFDEDLLLIKFMRLASWDSYKHAYANLLFSWGNYIERCEVLKTLSSPAVMEKEMVVYAADSSEVPPTGPSKGTGPAVLVKRPKCSICEITVRGLSLFCLSCGHGGHVQHMTNWFKLYADCPAGCGCHCKIATPEMLSEMAGSSAPMA